MFERLLDRMSGHPPSRSRFADRMRRAIQRSGCTETLIFEPEQFRFAYGKGACFYLGNAYHDYSEATRAERAGVLERYARVVQMQTEDEDPSFDEVCHLLVPVIRNRAAMLDLETQRTLQGGSADVGLQCRPFGPDCVTLLADRSTGGNDDVDGRATRAVEHRPGWRTGDRTRQPACRDCGRLARACSGRAPRLQER